MALSPEQQLESLIMAVATRSEQRFIADPEPGEKPQFSHQRRQLALAYVKCLVYTGQKPQTLPDVDISRLSEKRRGQICVRLASAWVDNMRLITTTPPFVTAPWFWGPYLQKELLRRETSQKPSMTR